MPQTTEILKNSFGAGILSPHLRGRADLPKHGTGLKTGTNVFINVEGGVSNRSGTRYLATLPGKARVIGFEFNNTDTYCLVFLDKALMVARTAGLVLGADGQPIKIVSPYPFADLAGLQYAQSGDVIYLTHKNHPPRRLERHSHTDWRFVAESYAPTIAAPTGLKVTAASAGSLDYSYKVVAIAAANGEKSLPSAEVSCKASDQPKNTLTWTAVKGADRYDVYKAENGIFGFIGYTNKTSFLDDNILPELADTPPEARNPFADGKNPACVAFHDQRRFMAGLKGKPDTVEASQPAAWANFNKSTPTNDGDAFGFTLASRRLADITGMMSLSSFLILLTTDAVWVARGPSEGEPMAPGKVVCSLQSERRGAKPLPPVIVGDLALYVESRGKTVRELSYSLERGGHIGKDLGILCRHLFRDREIIEWDYAELPDSLLWCVMSDGTMLTMTYVEEHQIVAWTEHKTDGMFVSVASVSEGSEDGVYFVVERGGKFMLERLASRQTTPITGAWFLDCALQYRGKDITEARGLDHLDGRTVSIFADGNVHPPQVVKNGSITLQRPAQVVVAGLPYVATFSPFSLAIQNAPAGGLAMRKDIPRMVVMMEDTRGLWVGTHDGNMVEVKRNVADSLEALSGDVEVNLPAAGWQRQPDIVFQQRDPLPFTVLAVVPKLAVTG